MTRIVLFALLCTVAKSDSKLCPDQDTEDPGSPLFLTPYIKDGQIEEARRLARVDFPGFPEVESYSGFFTVDKTYDSNQFFWYFPASNRAVEDSKVMLWLQGGPGNSSLFGLICENGPFAVMKKKFTKREVHWAKAYHLIYVDNPVGTGFSFTNDTRGYCTDQTQIAEHLYTTLTQFFQLFPELQQLPLLLHGETYAAKYVTALAYTIHKRDTAKTNMNLTGIIIGNGWCDPINQLDYGDFLEQIGLMDWNQRAVAEDYQNKAIELINKGAWREAYDAYESLMLYILKTMQIIPLHNYLDIHNEVCTYSIAFENATIRRAIHVGNLTQESSELIFDSLKEDFMRSITPWTIELLNHYSILFYSGQLSAAMPYPLMINFLTKLNFSGHDVYMKVERAEILAFSPSHLFQIAYLKKAGNLTEVLVRNAGNMVPVDQPEWIQAVFEIEQL